MLTVAVFDRSAPVSLVKVKRNGGNAGVGGGLMGAGAALGSEATEKKRDGA